LDLNRLNLPSRKAGVIEAICATFSRMSLRQRRLPDLITSSPKTYVELLIGNSRATSVLKRNSPVFAVSYMATDSYNAICLLVPWYPTVSEIFHGHVLSA